MIENGEEISKIKSSDYNSLIMQDLWQAHYQMLSIILLKEFIKLNNKTDDKKWEMCGNL